MNERLRRWLESIGISFGIFLVLNLLFFRSTDLFFLNKLFATTAAVLGGITLISGLLLRLNSSFSFLMTIRRQLGLLAFAFAILHVVISIFFLPSRFDFAWFTKEWIPITFGVIAILTWVYLTSISHNKKIIEMGSETWKKHLSIGAKIAFWAIYAHVIFLKYGSWISWFDGTVRRQPYPPLSFFLILFMSLVIILRLRRWKI